MKTYRFFLHYNKPLSFKEGIHYWSVHFRKKCYFTTQIECNVVTESKTNKTQPYVVMQGKCREIREFKDKLVIV